MKIKTDSLNIKFYCWFYGLDQWDLARQKNFCPIFWKLVLGYILAIPYTLWCLPVVIRELLDKRYYNGETSTGSRVAISFVIYASLLILFMMGLTVGMFFFKYPKDSVYLNLAAGGVLAWIGLIVFLIHQLYIKVKRKIEYRKTHDSEGNFIHREKRENILVEGFKAWYNKNCPRVEWVTDEEKSSED